MRDETAERLYILLLDLNQQWSAPMRILDVIRNEFLHAIGTDHIAVDHAGTPIARAADRAAVVQAAPDAAAYFSGADFEPAKAAPAPVAGVRDWATGKPTDDEPGWVSAATARSAPVAEVPATAPEPVAAATTPVDATVAPPAPVLDNAPTEPADAPTEQPPQDNDHVEPGAEEFPEPTVPAADPAKLN